MIEILSHNNIPSVRDKMSCFNKSCKGDIVTETTKILSKNSIDVVNSEIDALFDNNFDTIDY